MTLRFDHWLTHPKCEGCPIHPDEIEDTDMTDEAFNVWYDRQLKAYTEWKNKSDSVF